jgi:hypothetical protein
LFSIKLLKCKDKISLYERMGSGKGKVVTGYRDERLRIKGKRKGILKTGARLAVEKDFAKVNGFYYIYSMLRFRVVRSFCQEEVFVYIVDER